LLGRLDGYLSELREFDSIREDEFLNDGILQDALERRLQLATEVCMDIANGIVRLLGLRPPIDYVDLFRVLREEGLIDADFMRRLQGLVRYRNRLVHDYEILDPALVWAFRQNHLRDFSDFAYFVEAFLADHSGPSGE
jgi:uncharacterized protein YutE (UPF0331/DUF86 family)